jgi:hypothetical protein
MVRAARSNLTPIEVGECLQLPDVANDFGLSTAMVLK